MFFWNSFVFLMIQWMLAIWSLVPLLFLNPAWTSGNSQFTYCSSLAWRILSITSLVYEMRAIVQWFEHSLALPFFGIGMKTDLFQSCGHCWVFQICWHIECSTFTASSFSIWNTSAGIPSPPLALLVVMLPKARLTLHSRMSGSRWVITPLRLSGSWRSFLYSSSVYSCHLFLIPFGYQVHTVSVLYWAHLCMKSSLGISNFLKEISSVSHSISAKRIQHTSPDRRLISELVFLSGLIHLTYLNSHHCTCLGHTSEQNRQRSLSSQGL